MFFIKLYKNNYITKHRKLGIITDANLHCGIYGNHQIQVCPRQSLCSTSGNIELFLNASRLYLYFALKYVVSLKLHLLYFHCIQYVLNVIKVCLCVDNIRTLG